jgi:hypothetical protein
MPARPLLASLIVATIVLAGCRPAPEDEVADLCGDLRNLRETFAVLLAPPPDASLGEVRGALEKIAPFLDRVAGVDATSAAIDAEIEDVTEAVRDGLDGLGDDDPATRADESLRSARPRLDSVVAEAASALGCADAAP